MTPSPVSSTPILRTTLVWSLLVMVILAIAGGIIGFSIAGASGMWSALVGLFLAIAFFALTAASILFANRWFGGPLFVPIFFGVVLGGWLLKLVIFLVVILALRDQAWVESLIFFFGLIAGVLASLIVDAVVIIRMRIPHVSDITLPTAADIHDPVDDTEKKDASNGA